jgi:hypothetical protein
LAWYQRLDALKPLNCNRLLKLLIATLERVVTTDRNEILADARQLQQAARWSANDVARIAAANAPTIPVIAADDVRALIPGLDLWDSWPIQTRQYRRRDTVDDAVVARAA